MNKLEKISELTKDSNKLIDKISRMINALKTEQEKSFDEKLAIIRLAYKMQSKTSDLILKTDKL